MLYTIYHVIYIRAYIYIYICIYIHISDDRADSGQRTADFGRRSADEGQRTADGGRTANGQRTADGRQSAHRRGNRSALSSALSALWCQCIGIPPRAHSQCITPQSPPRAQPQGAALLGHAGPGLWALFGARGPMPQALGPGL